MAVAMVVAANDGELVGKAVLPGLGELRLIRAASCGAVLAPGQELFGRVEFHCVKTSLFVRGIWVKLVGRQSLLVAAAASASIDLLEGHEDHYLGGFHDVLYGFGEEDEASGTLFELREGLHRWNFAFKVPDSAAPSYCDAFTEVSYTATVVFDSPEVPLAVGQITYTAVVLPSAVVNSDGDSNSGSRGLSDVVALGAAPSLSFRPRQPTRTFFGMTCSSSSSSSSGSSSSSSVVMLTPDTAAEILDAPAPSSSLSSGRGLGTDPAAKQHAHTVMRVALSGDDGARGRCPGSSVAFDFEFVETTVKVDCRLATMCTGQPISLEARLLVCVLLRADSKAPFRTVRSLLQAPTANAAPSLPAGGTHKGSKLHVLQRADDAKKKRAAGTRKWLFRRHEDDDERDVGPWGACHAHQLWSRAVVLQAPDQPLAPVAVQFDVPVKINPFVRAACIADWPKPSPLPHDEHGAILNYTTKGGPLSEYRVILEVSAFELKGDIDILHNDRGGATGIAADKTNAKTPLCRPCYAEIHVRPPAPTRPVSAAPGARGPPRADAVAPTAPSQPVRVDPVGAPALPPRPRRRSASVVPATGPDAEAVSAGAASRSSRSSSASVAPVDAEGAAAAPARAEAAVLGVAGAGHRNRPPPNAADPENVHPNSQIAVVAATAAVKKAATPQARAVKHVPKVTAELVSRGPAAVLRDRTAPIHRDVQITPQRFAPAVPIAHGAVVVLDDLVTAAAATFDVDGAPTAARATITVTVGTPEGGGAASPSPRGGCTPADLMSPAMAFLCSPRTTELLLQQEREENERCGAIAIAEAANAAAETEADAVVGAVETCDAIDAEGADAAAAVALGLDDLPVQHAAAAPSSSTASSALRPEYTPSARPGLDYGCVTGLVLPFQLPPDSAPPTARGRDSVIATVNATAAAAANSPWVAGIAGVHFTQNGRRLSFSNLADGDAVSEFVEPMLSPPVALRG